MPASEKRRIMKLLLPIDGSIASLNAASKAAELSKKDGYLVIMLTVIKPAEIHAFKRYSRIIQQTAGSMLDRSVGLDDDDDSLRKLRNMATELQDDAAKKMNIEDVKLKREILAGEPYEVILDTAKSENVDLIVMGNRGYSKIKRFFVGSVTQRVISEASCPVLVIHTDAPE
jgi:nucleotide-binding universal stress UspA family protein